MRRDATIDRKQVYLPNVRSFGFSEYKCRVGYMLRWRSEDGREHLGRMIGRIAFAPSRGTPGEPHYSPHKQNWILVLRLNGELNHVHEAWVDPKEVFHCWDLKKLEESYKTDRMALLSFFLGEDLPKQPAQTLREWGEWGGRSWDAFQSMLKERVERDAPYRGLQPAKG